MSCPSAAKGSFAQSRKIPIKHSRTIIFSPQIHSPYLLRILFIHYFYIYLYIHTYGICLQKSGWSYGSKNSHLVEVALDDLGFPSTFIAALARSHAAKQRFTSSDCEFLRLMRFSSRNDRDLVPSLLDEILYAELF